MNYTCEQMLAVLKQYWAIRLFARRRKKLFFLSCKTKRALQFCLQVEENLFVFNCLPFLEMAWQL